MTIDWWTLGLQTVNILILVWLLGRFFWRPVAGMIEQRRAAAQQMLAEAQSTRAQAAAALAEIEQARAGFARERDAILAAAHEAAEQARTTSLEATLQEAASTKAAARAAIETERAEAEKAWANRAGRLAVEIAGRLAARLEGPAVRAAFLDWLLPELRRLPDPARRAMAANGVELEAVSATPLDAADQERYHRLISEALGAEPRIVFRADPALIAGFELHGPHLSVSNSWRADLARILESLSDDHGP